MSYRISSIGVGAIGSVAGGLLTKAGHDVTLIDQWPGGRRGRPSLLQDVMRGRRTEVQYLNGCVSEQGRHVGVPTPFNDKVVELITRVPPGTLKPDPRNLEPLVAMLSK